MVEAAIFDLDGLLIDSEPLWQEAETNVMKTLGVTLTNEMEKQTTGLRTAETVHLWYTQHPWSGPSEQEVGRQIDQQVLDLIQQKAKPKEGALETVRLCRELGLTLAIASSSSLAIINAAVKKLGIRDSLAAVHSAESDTYSKPNPEVYLDTAKILGVDPRLCLAFEDSLNGVLSAKAATMRCIAVPDPSQRHDPRFGIADVVVDLLLDVTPAMIKALQT